jgi:hypothetical protein
MINLRHQQELGGWKESGVQKNLTQSSQHSSNNDGFQHELHLHI